MQRKTNLFYTVGEDSNYISFSNYTESLTGNFLATDWKLFPSRFICMYIPKLEGNIEERSKFIKYISSYYENKLAFVRDYCIKNNENIESTLLPLAWLFETILKYDENSNITFFSDITEQDYNGIYADTICTITGTDNGDEYLLTSNNIFNKSVYYKINDTILSTEYLYGWYDEYYDEDEQKCTKYTGPTYYNTVKPNFDEITDQGPVYTIGCKYSEINVVQSEKLNDIKFNIVIPLFDVTNINYRTNINIINENNNIDISTNIADNETGYIINVPMGIWFAPETVILKRDANTGYAPSWSLLLSSQFKPFPYSQKMPSEISESEKLDAFATYAQVLVKQNELIDKFDNIYIQLSNLSNRIESIETKIKNIGSQYNIDSLKIEMINFEKYITNILEANGINTSEDKLKWKAYYTE